MTRAWNNSGHPAGASGLSAAQPRKELDLFDVLALAWSERGFIVLLAAVMMAIGVAASLTLLKPSYTAHSRLLVLLNEDPTPAAAGWGDGFMLNQVMQSESELMSSNAVRTLAFETLGAEAILGEPVLGSGRVPALKALRDGFSVSRAPNSSALNASYVTGDPERAAMILNTIVASYLAYREQVLVETGMSGLGERRRQADVALAQSEAELEAFLQANGLSNFETEEQTAQNLLGNLTDRINTARSSHEAYLAGAAALRERLEQIPEQIELYVENGVSGRLLDLRAERASLLSRYQEGAPAVAAVDREIEALQGFIQSGATEGQGQSRSGPNPVRQQLESELATREANARAEASLITSLQEQLTATRQDIQRLRALGPEYTRLAQDVEAAEAAASNIAGLEASALSARSDAPGAADFVRVIDRATPPLDGASKKKLALLASAVLSFGVALFLGLLRGYWRTYLAPGMRERAGHGSPAQTLAPTSAPPAAPAFVARAPEVERPANDPFDGLPVLARITDRTA
ncbi:GumC family protein [Maricaulis parjimensis]|uniref:GumC family protein n=1 Tax=Maricaulis parjimensis TaxID=144023 RepID=UPI001939CA5C|nr:Wzz/FepE/Etk N-terminal domain-containing protein [Maricaulis parjimensis]